MRLKRFISVLTVTSVFLCTAATAQAAFSDVSENSRYFTAIDYLSSAGIIKGYPDGTFGPGNPVNRAEFLKLALESSGIVSDISTPSPFSDVDENAWYAKYVRKAYSEGWIKGYGDGTFHPENPIIKAEGIKIIGEIQEWKLPDISEAGPFNDTPAGIWFTPYVSYAKEHNFLEETGRYFIPEALLTRERTAEILFRTYATGLNDADTYEARFALTPPPVAIPEGAPDYESPTIPEETAVADNFTPVRYNEYPADFFENAILSEKFPNTFYLNEMFYFEGTSRSDGEKAYVFLIPENEDDQSKYINYVADFEAGGFRIPVYFRKAGNYKLGLIPGNADESKVLNISVLSALPPGGTETGMTPSNPVTAYKNGDSTITWNSGGNGLIRLHLTQGARKKTFIFRQGVSSFDIPYVEFNGFSESTTEVSLEGAVLESERPLVPSGPWKNGGKTLFTATGHHFTENDGDSIRIVTLPETYEDNGTITFSGTAKNDIAADAAVTKPDGSVETVRMASTLPYGEFYSSDTIPTGSTFTFRYKPPVFFGTYIVEINGLKGEAVLNYPVYPKNRIPLMPDFVDLASYLDEESAQTIDAMRTKLLNLINASRIAAGLSSVKMDPSLNNLAQLHSEDMVKRIFFGHINPDGETPDDRRLKLMIPTSVGENLAKAPTIAYAHNGLMRSGVHRQNILDPDWTRVGIGAVKGSDGYILITEEFSYDPLTEIDLINIEKEILNDINRYRNSLGLASYTLNSSLSQAADEWSAKMAAENFFDFVSPDGETLSTVVREVDNTHVIQAQILEAPDKDNLIEEILKSGEIDLQTWNTIGIGLKVDNIGNIKATLLYSAY